MRHTTGMMAATLPMPDLAGVEHRDEVVDGVRLHYAEAGEGEPLVLLHGWPQHWWSWHELIGPLAERFRVIVPDIRGMGWSDAPRTGYSRERLTLDLLGLLDALGLERVRLVGHDWGLLIGYWTAFTRPERLERFVPMGGVHPWSAQGAPPRLFIRPWHIYLLSTPGGEVWTRRFGIPEVALRTWRARGRFTREEVEIYCSPLRRELSAHATTQRDRQIVLHDIPWFVRNSSRLRLRVPTLHLNGADDPLTQLLPDSWRGHADDMRFEAIPDCGHFLAEERPNEVLDRMLDFLA